MRKVICSYHVGDDNSSSVFGWINDDPVGLTKDQLDNIATDIIKEFFTKDMANEGKHACLSTTDAESMECLSYVKMSAEQRLAMAD